MDIKKILIIAFKELKSYFDSLVAYILIVAFLGFSGFFTWLYGADVFISGQASLQVFFSISFWTLFFFIPALTMRSLAEEKKTGTIEFLLTKAITDREVVVGKFLSIFFLILITLFLTLTYYISIARIGNVDHAAIICGYFGLILMSAMYISIGIFVSSTTNNQIVAFLLALFVGLFFHIIFGVLASSFTGFLSEIFQYLNTNNHFESISRGVIDTKDVVFFLAVTFIGLFLAELNLTKRNISNL